MTVGERRRVSELRQLRWKDPWARVPNINGRGDWRTGSIQQGAGKAHSLIDKVYKRKNLEIAWKKVKANQGAGGVDGENIESFDERLDERLAQLHVELKTDTYRHSPRGSDPFRRS